MRSDVDSGPGVGQGFRVWKLLLRRIVGEAAYILTGSVYAPGRDARWKIVPLFLEGLETLNDAGSWSSSVYIWVPNFAMLLWQQRSCRPTSCTALLDGGSRDLPSMANAMELRCLLLLRRQNSTPNTQITKSDRELRINFKKTNETRADKFDPSL